MHKARFFLYENGVVIKFGIKIFVKPNTESKKNIRCAMYTHNNFFGNFLRAMNCI